MPAIRFNIDVLNAVSAGLGGGGGHRRSLAALNDICRGSAAPAATGGRWRRSTSGRCGSAAPAGTGGPSGP